MGKFSGQFSSPIKSADKISEHGRCYRLNRTGSSTSQQ